MFKKSIVALTLVAFTAPFAGAAFAGSGSDELARQLGVAPGAYTDAQLIQLDAAKRDREFDTYNFILSQGNGVASRGDSAGSATVSVGAAELAKSLGLAPGAYSVSSMIQLQNAIDDRDTQAISFILGGSKDGNSGNDRGVVTPGKADLARALGLDPANYTTSELVAKYLDFVS